MAGRPRKKTMFDDIKEIETPKEEVVEKEAPVEEPKADIKRTGVVKTDSWLNVRGGPAPSYPIIGKLNNGETVIIYETSKGFGKISITEDKWVNLDFVI